jgi:hypothetical protein
MNSVLLNFSPSTYDIQNNEFLTIKGFLTAYTALNKNYISEYETTDGSLEISIDTFETPWGNNPILDQIVNTSQPYPTITVQYPVNFNTLSKFNSFYFYPLTINSTAYINYIMCGINANGLGNTMYYQSNLVSVDEGGFQPLGPFLSNDPFINPDISTICNQVAWSGTALVAIGNNLLVTGSQQIVENFGVAVLVGGDIGNFSTSPLPWYVLGAAGVPGRYSDRFLRFGTINTIVWAKGSESKWVVGTTPTQKNLPSIYYNLNADAGGTWQNGNSIFSNETEHGVKYIFWDEETDLYFVVGNCGKVAVGNSLTIKGSLQILSYEFTPPSTFTANNIAISNN